MQSSAGSVRPGPISFVNSTMLSKLSFFRYVGMVQSGTTVPKWSEGAIRGSISV